MITRYGTSALHLLVIRDESVLVQVQYSSTVAPTSIVDELVGLGISNIIKSQEILYLAKKGGGDERNEGRCFWGR
jgi:hypothetical protein